MESENYQSENDAIKSHWILQHKNVSAQINQMAVLQDNIIMTMVNLIETRDGTSGGHAKRAVVYISYLLKKILYTNTCPMQLSEESMELIIKAAPLYDIGKIAISDMILQKPGRLSEEEFELVKTHTTIGSELIRKNLGGIVDNTFLHLAAEMAASHHEWWNGNGYPAGLKGTEIPLCARVTAIADVFDALVSKTYYSGQRDFKEAVRIMRENEGHFDPVLLELFLEDEAELKRIMDSNQKNVSRCLMPENGLLNFGNHKDFYCFMLDLYLDELEEKVPKLKNLLEQKQYTDIILCAFSLKASSRDAGAQPLATLADCVVFAAQEENNDSLRKYLERLEECAQKTRTEVREYLLHERTAA